MATSPELQAAAADLAEWLLDRCEPQDQFPLDILSISRGFEFTPLDLIEGSLKERRYEDEEGERLRNVLVCFLRLNKDWW